MLRASLAILLVVGCAPVPPGATPHGPTVTPTATRAPLPPLPAKAAPTVAYADGAISSIDLPAVAADGSVVVVAHQDNDGGRGNANLTLIAIDRHDAPVASLVVLTVDETERLADQPSVMRERFALANRWLAKLHAERRLVPLTVLAAARAASQDEGCHCLDADPHAGVTWTPSVVRITWDGQRVVERATPTSWLAATHPLYAGSEEQCTNPARLEAGAVDHDRRLALVVVSYEGTDTCWEPSSQEHVVAW
ncbi:MAG: hypothetical protein NT062_13145 [Proteobacteria bacterium]|nr:hypothetical protein [Pseudomonadota bacterium]